MKNSDLMWKQSVWTSVIASSIAARHLKEGGAVVFTGAQAAIQGTPGKHMSHKIRLHTVPFALH